MTVKNGVRSQQLTTAALSFLSGRVFMKGAVLGAVLSIVLFWTSRFPLGPSLSAHGKETQGPVSGRDLPHHEQGDHREAIFRSDKDRELFLKTLGEACGKTDWPVVDRLLGEHGIPKDSPAGRKEFERRVEWRRASQDDEEFSALNRGWYVGSERFRKELLDQMKAGPENYGEEIRQSGEQKALKRIERELKKLGCWSAPKETFKRFGSPKCCAKKRRRRWAGSRRLCIWAPKHICRICSTGMVKKRRNDDIE